MTPPVPPSARAARSVRFAALFSILVPLAWLVWRFAFVSDDAYITFRYSDNWAKGLGFVFNPGVQPPVEGYSEFLWAFLMGVGIKVGISPVWFSQSLSILAAVALAVGWVHYCSRMIANGPIALCGGGLFLGCLPPLGVWATGGMATMPFCAAVFWLFTLTWLPDVQGRTWKVGALAVLVVLLRADGAWWVAWVLGPACIGSIAGAHSGEQSQRLKPLLSAVGISLCAWGLHLLWRHGFYGDWMPNTARAKVGISMRASERGYNYLMHFLLVFPGVFLAFVSLASARCWRERHLGAALGVILGTGLHVILTGGDFMAFGRFTLPALPFVALLLCAGLSGLEEQGSPVGAGIYTLVCCALVVPPALDADIFPVRWRTAFGFRHNTPAALERSEWGQWFRMREQASEWVDLGKALKLVAEPGDSVVTGAVGGVGFYSGLTVYDRNGLVTREVALRAPLPQATSPGHDKTVPPEFFNRYKPTFLASAWFPGGLGALKRYRKDHPGILRPGLLPVDLDPEQSPRPNQTLLLERGPE